MGFFCFNRKIQFFKANENTPTPFKRVLVYFTYSKYGREGYISYDGDWYVDHNLVNKNDVEFWMEIPMKEKISK